MSRRNNTLSNLPPNLQEGRERRITVARDDSTPNRSCNVSPDATNSGEGVEASINRKSRREICRLRAHTTGRHIFACWSFEISQATPTARQIACTAVGDHYKLTEDGDFTHSVQQFAFYYLMRSVLRRARPQPGPCNTLHFHKNTDWEEVPLLIVIIA